MNISDNVKNPKLLLFAIAIASFMSSLDSCIVNIALPTLSVAFDVSTGLVSWVVTIYLLVLTSSLMIFGKLSDRIGFRRIFLVGFLVFVLGSLFCALSPTFIMLVISRAIQA
ncbi:MAG: MFS transporter, partial [Methanomicrobiales archaeon]|nr:MFS transporter [Methanomicrobiales archaeon]